jgi:WhiB family redox-sensing transcriptional regulator
MTTGTITTGTITTGTMTTGTVTIARGGAGTRSAEWMGRGRCRDMDPATFFPSDGVGVRSAQLVCAECDVQTACLNYALANRIDEGVWGGTSERQRRRLLRQHRSASPEIPSAPRAADAGEGAHR